MLKVGKEEHNKSKSYRPRQKGKYAIMDKHVRQNQLVSKM
jgi:hypothetical protein